MSDTGSYEILKFIDVDATKHIYENYVPYECTCSHCRNFRLQWAQLIANDIVAILNAFGIDPLKAIEIIDFGENAPGIRTCQVEWAFLILHDPPPLTVPSIDTVNGAQIYFLSTGNPAPPFDKTGKRWSLRVQCNRVPWLLTEPA